MFYRVVPFVLIPLIGINAGVSANELNPDVSVTLDGYYKQNDTALSHRKRGSASATPSSLCLLRSMIFSRDD